MSFKHLIAFGAETKIDVSRIDGPIKHIENYINEKDMETAKRIEEKYTSLISFLKDNMNEMPKEKSRILRDIMIASHLIEVDTMDPEPSKPAKGKGKGKEKEKEAVCPCGVLTKSKAPCKKKGLPEFGGKCKQHGQSAPSSSVVPPPLAVAPVVESDERSDMSDEDRRVIREMNGESVPREESNYYSDYEEEGEDIDYEEYETITDYE